MKSLLSQFVNRTVYDAKIANGISDNERERPANFNWPSLDCGGGLAIAHVRGKDQQDTQDGRIRNHFLIKPKLNLQLRL